MVGYQTVPAENVADLKVINTDALKYKAEHLLEHVRDLARSLAQKLKLIGKDEEADVLVCDNPEDLDMNLLDRLAERLAESHPHTSDRLKELADKVREFKERLPSREEVTNRLKESKIVQYANEAVFKLRGAGALPDDEAQDLLDKL